jgi:hypothetical protein
MIYELMFAMYSIRERWMASTAPKALPIQSLSRIRRSNKSVTCSKLNS